MSDIQMEIVDLLESTDWSPQFIAQYLDIPIHWVYEATVEVFQDEY